MSFAWAVFISTLASAGVQREAATMFRHVRLILLPTGKWAGEYFRPVEFLAI
jgi:hypothetical protein